MHAVMIGLASLVMAFGAAVAPSGRHLLDDKGKPFFWLGDTAWMLFQAPDRAGVERYLDARARQRFTVIQAAVVMAEERVAGTLRPNAFGHTAFIDGDPARPKITPGDDYWDHADWVVDAVEKRGLTLALLPIFIAHRGDGYKYLKPDNAERYGRFLGERYGKKKHIIWVLGGDNTPDKESSQAAWNAMAEGLGAGAHGGKALMTYHINGVHSSSEWWHDAPWLDFNMIQTWGSHTKIQPLITTDYARTPPKPTGLAEGAYENGPQYPSRPIDALMIRRQAYWSYFAGGYHSYGNTDVWNFGTYAKEAFQDWKEALESPGARHLTVLRGFFESFKWWRYVPDRALGPAVLRSLDGEGLVAYMDGGEEISLDVTGFRRLEATWVDPRSGTRAAAGRVAGGKGARSFTKPVGWEDALLVLRARK